MNNELSYPVYFGARLNLFALKSGGFIISENITESQLFDLIERFYTPEFTDFIIEYWNVYANPPQWIEL